MTKQIIVCFLCSLHTDIFFFDGQEVPGEEHVGIQSRRNKKNEIICTIKYLPRLNIAMQYYTATVSYCIIFLRKVPFGTTYQIVYFYNMTTL